MLQVALSLVLVVAAGLFTRTFFSLTTRDAGFESDSVLVVNVNVPTSTSGPKPEARRRELYEQLRQRGGHGSRHLAGRSVFHEPVGRLGLEHWHRRPGHCRSDRAGAPVMGQRGQPRLVRHLRRPPRGRPRRSIRRDRMGAPRVAIVNRAFAKRFFNGENPIGRQFVTERAERSLGAGTRSSG